MASLGFIAIISVSVSLSSSTNPYKCLTQVADTFSGSFNSWASCTLNNLSARIFFKLQQMLCEYACISLLFSEF